MSTYVPPSRLTMDSNELLQSPNFNQQKNHTAGNVTPPIMTQNFMPENLPTQEESNLQLQKQLLIQQLKQELIQGQPSPNSMNPNQLMRKKSRTRELAAASMNHHPHQMLYNSQMINPNQVN